ncbi:hypothetical protein E2C01_030224 [Portunus trituberculatus]|uniref:Uncharacterized protein n=1 Tax=Portunus trituberculatus TaxID=210409 RepID=A0A5B7EUB6_PORTR|nr:hypothetical protein [Portunus trituberculatus]
MDCVKVDWGVHEIMKGERFEETGNYLTPAPSFHHCSLLFPASRHYTAEHLQQPSPSTSCLPFLSPVCCHLPSATCTPPITSTPPLHTRTPEY